ncbi:MAG: hypothetical protein ACRDPY_22370 [Streptosporangiaceae bacterium]
MTTISENADTFCRMVEARSREHREAMQVALDKGWLAIAGSVLRMELDSMIRVIWLLHHPDTREQILASCIAGEGFSEGRTRVSDHRMAKDATEVNGWVQAVYDFGNTFVHLTNAHDYAVLDPFQTYEHRGEVIRFLNNYHRGKVPGVPVNDSSTLRDLAAYAPYVLEKITSNLDLYVRELREQCVRR